MKKTQAFILWPAGAVMRPKGSIKERGYLNMAKYTIGIDYGSLSGRAILVNVQNGQEVASCALSYPHQVMDRALPSGKTLGQDWALQHPQDYLDVLYKTVPAIMAQKGIHKEDVIGIGVDFTSCTVLPTRKDGTPLCFLPEYANRPHAYAKLWKHHAAQKEASQITALAEELELPWLKDYGGKISSEWLFPKLLEILHEAPDIYEKMYTFIEAGDWIVWQLTQSYGRSLCAASYKAMYHYQSGYPDQDFLKALDPRLEHVISEKHFFPLIPLGSPVGTLTPAMAEQLGLMAGIPVASANVDGHVCIPAVGIDQGGDMLAIIGTSTAHILMSDQAKQVPGICGISKDGVLPGFFGYDAGQCCVGDHFAWVADTLCPPDYTEKARQKGMVLHEYLTFLAQKQAPGEHGLLALDWFNGNRSILVDADLTGLFIGLSLQTGPEDLYRALIEATAYGTKMIVENYRRHGVKVNRFFASGGISQKNPMAMQIYADVLNMPVYIAKSNQGPALGSAIFAAVAAGEAGGGYKDIFDATHAMGKPSDVIFTPIPQHVAIYQKLFEEYEKLHDYFGRGENNIMKTLKALRQEAQKVK